MINVFQPTLGYEEVNAVSEVFQSGWLGAGKKVEKFTSKFAFHLGVAEDQLITTSSCTDGLFMAMELCGVGGYEVILPTIHFVGAVNAVMAAGGYPVFCDVDPLTLNPTLEHIESVVSDQTKAVCILHYGGRPCDDIKKIADFCSDNELFLIEDSACSLNSRIYGKACGTFGDIGLWSFDPMKLLSCGDGGMMYIFDHGLMERAKKMAFFGLNKKSGLSASAGGNIRWWEFDVDAPGRYSSMNDIDAAIMIEQLASLPDFVKHRALIDLIYRGYLSDIPNNLTICPPIQEGAQHSHYFFWVQTTARDSLAYYLKENGIYTTFRYHPLHKVEYYGKRKFFDRSSVFPGAEVASYKTLLLPIHAALSIDNVVFICGKVREFFTDQPPDVAG